MSYIYIINHSIILVNQPTFGSSLYNNYNIPLTNSINISLVYIHIQSTCRQPMLNIFYITIIKTHAIRNPITKLIKETYEKVENGHV